MPAKEIFDDAANALLTGHNRESISRFLETVRKFAESHASDRNILENELRIFARTGRDREETLLLSGGYLYFIEIVLEEFVRTGRMLPEYRSAAEFYITAWRSIMLAREPCH